MAEMADPHLAAVHGGLVVRHPDSGAIRGGIGVSGLTAPEDEDIARLGLQAVGFSMHSHPGGKRLCQSGSG